MKIQHLAAHGFSKRALEHLARHVPTLLPLQHKVIAETGLLRGQNVIVFAPTSSGKTLLGELAALRHFERHRKSIFLVPTKALAEEQYARLRRLYSPLGVRVAIATRERTAHDRRFAEGQYDFGVMVYEKLGSFLTLSPGMAAHIGLVVVDELQIVGDPQRGTCADMLLTKLGRLPEPPQMVCLSAVLSENARLASWLRSDFFVWRERPVELREGVLDASTGEYLFREFNSGCNATEQIVKPAAVPDCDEFDELEAVTRAARELVGRGEQVLVFVPTRDISRRWAFHLAERLGASTSATKHAAGSSASPEIGHAEESHSRDLLVRCFEGGVAFHNADLPHSLRSIVEDAFRDGRLRVLIATSTLAQGVNLTCRNVISVPVMMLNEAGTGRPTEAPLTCQRFRNQGGRGGRYLAGDHFGRSILIAAGAAQAEALRAKYIVGEVEPLEPASGHNQLPELLLDAVHGAGCRTLDDARALLLATYAGMTSWVAEPGFAAVVDDASDKLLKHNLIRQREGRLEPTGAGQAAAAFGLKLRTAAAFVEFCESAATLPELDELHILALCCFSEDGREFPLAATQREVLEQTYARQLNAWTDEVASAPGPLKEWLLPPGGFTAADQASLKKMFLAQEWLSAEATPQIEEHFRVFAGTIANLASHIAWLAQALGAIAAALGRPARFCRSIQQLAERLPEGVTPEGVALARLETPGLSRGFIAALIREGFDTPQSLASVDPRMLQSILPADLAQAVIAAARETTQYSIVAESTLPWFGRDWRRSPDPEKRGAESDGFIIDPNSPGMVWTGNQSVELSARPYQLLMLLARSPRKVVPYDQIEKTLWPDSVVERQQITQHKRAIEKALGQTGTDRPLIRTLSGHGLCLNAEVQIRG